MARLAANREAARNDVILSAQDPNISLDQFLEGVGSTGIQQLLDETGLTETALKGLFISNASEDTKLGETTAGGKKIFFFRGPDGTKSTIEFDVGLSDTDDIVFDKAGNAIKVTYSGEPGEPGSKIIATEKIDEFERAGESGDKPLSINQIDKFRRNFGWTPPLGFTMGQLRKYMDDNPDASPKELEAGARQALGEVDRSFPESEAEANEQEAQDVGNQFLSEEYFRTNFSQDELKKLSDRAGTSNFFSSKKADIDRFLKETMRKVQEAREAGHTDQEISEFLIGETRVAL